MRYRKHGKTGLMVIEIGFGGEWLERHDSFNILQFTLYTAKKRKGGQK